MAGLHRLCFGTLFSNLICWIQLCDKRNQTFVACCDKGSLILFFKICLISFYLKRKLMINPFYLYCIRQQFLTPLGKRDFQTIHEFCNQPGFFLFFSHNFFHLLMNKYYCLKKYFNSFHIYGPV